MLWRKDDILGRIVFFGQLARAERKVSSQKGWRQVVRKDLISWEGVKNDDFKILSSADFVSC